MQPFPMKYASSLIDLFGLLALPVRLTAGHAVAVTQNVVLLRGGQERYLERGQSVDLDDIITTDANGRAQLPFRDETKIVIGPNFQLIIERVFG